LYASSNFQLPPFHDKNENKQHWFDVIDCPPVWNPLCCFGFSLSFLNTCCSCVCPPFKMRKEIVLTWKPSCLKPLICLWLALFVLMNQSISDCSFCFNESINQWLLFLFYIRYSGILIWYCRHCCIILSLKAAIFMETALGHCVENKFSVNNEWTLSASPVCYHLTVSSGINGWLLGEMKNQKPGPHVLLV